MVSTAIIPRLCKLIECGALDVYSAKHIRRLVHLADEVEVSVGDGNAKLQVRILISVKFSMTYANHRGFSSLFWPALNRPLPTRKHASRNTDLVVVHQLLIQKQFPQDGDSSQDVSSSYRIYCGGVNTQVNVSASAP